ncbi:MAG: STAS domain-containing protein [Lachnospiraceae bacterium]|nr:STAS domain-containing protein [Lachnospiraceae bacterium]
MLRSFARDNAVSTLVIDFTDLAYISSAGLRVILSAQIIMNRQGNMVVCNVNEDMMEVFEVTGGKFRYFCPPVRSSC